jgi:hypothetical protein
MFTIFLLTLALATLSISTPARKNQSPIFEDSTVFRARYKKLNCAQKLKSDITFFLNCCEPRPQSTDVDLSLNTLPEECLATTTATKASGGCLNGEAHCLEDVSLVSPPHHDIHGSHPTSTPRPTHSPTTRLPTTTAPAPKPTWASGSGKGTYYYQGGRPGACGDVHLDSDKVVALQTKTYHKGKYCKAKIHIINTKNNKSVTAIVADECPGCSTKHSMQSIDMSEATFKALAPLDEGVISGECSYS